MSFVPLSHLLKWDNPVNPEVSNCVHCASCEKYVTAYSTVLGCSFGFRRTVEMGLCREYSRREGEMVVKAL